jgi:hypothetical protein
MEMVLGVWLCCGQEGSEVFDRFCIGFGGWREISEGGEDD